MPVIDGLASDDFLDWIHRLASSEAPPIPERIDLHALKAMGLRLEAETARITRNRTERSVCISSQSNQHSILRTSMIRFQLGGPGYCDMEIGATAMGGWKWRCTSGESRARSSARPAATDRCSVSWL